ncbi:g6338 [Coccomyxa viridis]|uniref:ER membrane protein complex subunit 3 n=1 Tax=Coccomyxa viridis TaxID=1274662 RepID=A0ABP1FV63_9CHLO
MGDQIVLDRDVRDWVLVPLTMSIVLMMLIRQYATQVLMGGGKPQQKVELKEVKEKQTVARSQLLRGAHVFLTEGAFRQRKAYLTAKGTGALSQKSEQKSAQEQMLTNPDLMSGMMKQNLSGIVPQIAMGTFVSYFFSGFILGKIPFPLSPSFRLMLQRGVDLPSLDVTYFTSLSYYILLLFGLRGVFMLFFRENTIDETQMYRQQMGMGGGGNPMAAMTSADPTKALEAERAALEMVDHKWKLEGAEDRAADVLRARLKQAPHKRKP